jgi:hypothetical protein
MDIDPAMTFSKYSGCRTEQPVGRWSSEPPLVMTTHVQTTSFPVGLPAQWNQFPRIAGTSLVEPR